MNLLETITVRAAEKKLPFLLAGGHAVIVHGYQRTTFDVDLVIPRPDRDAWLELMKGLGYTLFHEGPAFLQLNPPSGGRWQPVDLAFLNRETFDRLRADSLPNPLGPAFPSVVSLRHLVAMKCHAIKHGHPGRVVKDMDDVINLFMANRLNPAQTEWRELVLKYGTSELQEKLVRVCQRD